MSRLVTATGGNFISSHPQATPYPSPLSSQTVLTAVKTLSKKQDDLFEKVYNLEKKL